MNLEKVSFPIVNVPKRVADGRIKARVMNQISAFPEMDLPYVGVMVEIRVGKIMPIPNGIRREFTFHLLVGDP